MKKILAMTLALLWTAPALAADLRVEWEMTNPPTDLASFNLYLDEQPVCTFPGDLREAECEVQISDAVNSFTLTAVDAAGQESPHSVPFVFDPPPSAPGILTISVK